MTTSGFKDRRVLVVGASAGIGRSFATRCVRAGAEVVLCARRRPNLEEVVAETGGGTVVVGDIGFAGDAARVVAESVSVLGHLDVILFAAGTGTVVRMGDARSEQWMETLATNVVGFNEVVRAAVPSMSPHGIVAALSSETVGRPRTAMGPYGVSKAALDQSILSWRLEHPELRFTQVTVGATLPTEFGADFEPGLLTEALGHWVRHGVMQRRFMATDEVAGVLFGVLGTALSNPSVTVEQLRLRSPSGPAASLDEVDF